MRATQSITVGIIAFTVLASLLVALVKVQPMPALALNGKGQASFSGNIEGTIVDERNGHPIADARVQIVELNLATTSDSLGRFAWKNLPMTASVMPVTVSVTVSGFGEWTLKDVRLVAADTLILHPRLTEAPYLDVVSPPHIRLAEPSHAIQESLPTLEALAGHTAEAPLPPFIRVRVAGYPYHCDTTRDYRVEVVDFRQYARHVLPNEWNPFWPANSLRAGAMAVKMYAWFWVALGGKWKDADVWDSTCDQVYNPNFEYTSTSTAVDITWNWVLSRAGFLLPTYYRTKYSQCEDASLEGDCMGQEESRDLANEGLSWEAILRYFYRDVVVSAVKPPPSAGFTLRYNGTPGDVNENRVLIPVDDPTTNDPGPPVDVGADDFTIEWWLKSMPDDNSAPGFICGKNRNWNLGNIILDRTLSDSGHGFGVSLGDGRLIFGVSAAATGNLTLCGVTDVRDGRWHHVAIQRRSADGFVWIFLDGRLEASADGPAGDISYPDDLTPGLENDPFLSLGAWKLDDDHELHPFFRGWIDEMRFSNMLRYLVNFERPREVVEPDGNTLTLYHFDEGIGDLVSDAALYAGGQSHGTRQFGGSLNGPEWVPSDLFHKIYLPLVSH